MTDEARKQFETGKFRTELRLACPSVKSADAEWIIAYFASEAESQFEAGRLQELSQIANLLTNIAQILDVIKQEWGTAWSTWDQEQRDEITKWLVAAAAIREKK